MPRNGRRHLPACLLLALHATASLCGPGHHALEGVVGLFSSKAWEEPPTSASSGAAWSVDEECPACVHGLLPAIAAAAVPSPLADIFAAASPAPITTVAGPSGPIVSSPRAPPPPV